MAAPKTGSGEARLWAVAFFVSVVVNGALLAWISIESIRAELKRQSEVAPAVSETQVVRIFPEMILQETPDAEVPVEPVKPQTVRTSADQESAEAPASRRFVGERNTRATSDREASADGPELPSQAGREARPGELETTESAYQDGELRQEEMAESSSDGADSPSDVPDAADALAEQLRGEPSPEAGESESRQAAIREELLDGPNPVEVPVKPAEASREIEPREESVARDGRPDGKAEVKLEEEAPEAKPETATVRDPAFRGNQSKTAIRGSISRTGRSALDVADTPMGRYQAAISRAVELEWQRNCVRHRDFITPGFLTVRFFVEPSGRVRKLDFVGKMETGEVQKGFTLNSIRDAGIPPMPPAVKKEMDGDALELLFNFYF